MSWIDRLQKASFRGVPFFVESHEAANGRRLAKFEFPMLDVAQVDDLGKKLPGYKIRAFVIGDDYDTQRNLLVQACANRSTTGSLVHPYLPGTRQVRCESCSVHEQMSRGGIAEIDLEFVLAGPIPVMPVDTSSRLIAGIVSALAVIRSAFALTMLVVDNPRILIAAAVGLLGLAGEDLLTSLTGFPADVLNGLLADVSLIASAPSDAGDTADAVSAAFMGAADAAVAQSGALPDLTQPVDPVTGYDVTVAAPSDPSYGLVAMAT
ncbi:MAG: DNA circularization N-terminal domain-containing protein, partial [Janthinobacterium lividum]